MKLSNSIKIPLSIQNHLREVSIPLKLPDPRNSWCKVCKHNLKMALFSRSWCTVLLSAEDDFDIKRPVNTQTNRLWSKPVNGHINRTIITIVKWFRRNDFNETAVPFSFPALNTMHMSQGIKELSFSHSIVGTHLILWGQWKQKFR